MRFLLESDMTQPGLFGFQTTGSGQGFGLLGGLGLVYFGGHQNTITQPFSFW